MRKRGTGSVFRNWYYNGKGEKQFSDVLSVKYHCRGTCGRDGCPGFHREQTGIKFDAPSADKKAEKFLRDRLAQIDKGRLTAPAVEKTTLGELGKMLLTDYSVNGRKSGERARISIAHLQDFFGSTTRAVAITTDRINSYIAARQQAKAAPATIRCELAALKRAFTLGAQAGKVGHRPHVPSIEVRNTRSGFFEEADFRAVLGHLPEDLQPLAEFFYLTGWRKEEVLSLTWRNVDFVAGEIRLEPGTTKNEDGRTFPFNIYPPLGDLIRRQRERTSAVEKATGRIIDHVFHRNGRPIRDYRDTWDKAVVAAGVPGRLVHDFRRTAVRNLERAGVPRSVAMRLTGHRTETVYKRYAIVSPTDLRDGVRRLAALHEQAAGRQEHVVVPITRTVPVRSQGAIGDRNAAT